MPDRPVRIPGPDHAITITRNQARVVVASGGKVIADSVAALTLREASYPPVQYIRREDADMTLLQRTSHTSWCPYKGEASYYSIPAAGPQGDNAVWSYETPHAAVEEIRGHLAFYPDRVDAIEERD